MLQLIRCGHIENQGAARLDGPVGRPEKAQEVFFSQQIIHPVAGCQHGIHRPVKIQRPHILLHKGHCNSLLPGLLRRFPEHFPADIHTGHLESPPVQRNGQPSGSAGAFADLSVPDAVNGKQAGIIIRPAFIVHVVHQFIIQLGKCLIHLVTFPVTCYSGFVSSSSSSSSSSGVRSPWLTLAPSIRLLIYLSNTAFV